MAIFIPWWVVVMVAGFAVAFKGTRMLSPDLDARSHMGAIFILFGGVVIGAGLVLALI